MNKPLILVTGASKGIGRAISIAMSSTDIQIVCISRSDQKGLLETVQAIKNKGFDAYPILCDLSNYSEIQEMFEEIDNLNAPIHGLINNAGISSIKLFTDTTYEEWMHVLQTNLTSVFSMCHFVVPRMLRNHFGHIINISSIWGNDGASMEVAYSASKGGVNTFTKALAKELGPSNIRVNAIACGVIDTEMNHHLSEEERLDLMDSISLGRYGSPEEVALFLKGIYDSAPYLNGQIITYDGGRL